MLKKSSLLGLCALLLGAMVPVSAQAAERPTTIQGCKMPTSKAHQPAKVAQPTTAAKKMFSTMTIYTNCGPIVISMNGKAAPITVTSLSALAQAKYFDGTFCHRLTTEGIYVLQCGDPTASGSGSPTGWKGYKDENLPANKSANYPAGTVAMANSGASTNGSQFFLVYKDTTLPPNYTIWGKITTGLALLQKMEKIGAYQVDQATNNAYYTGDGLPVQPVEVLRVSVR